MVRPADKQHPPCLAQNEIVDRLRVSNTESTACRGNEAKSADSAREGQVCPMKGSFRAAAVFTGAAAAVTLTPAVNAVAMPGAVAQVPKCPRARKSRRILRWKTVIQVPASGSTCTTRRPSTTDLVVWLTPEPMSSLIIIPSSSHSVPATTSALSGASLVLADRPLLSFMRRRRGLIRCSCCAWPGRGRRCCGSCWMRTRISLLLLMLAATATRRGGHSLDGH